MQDVGAWLRSVGLEALVERFAANDIDAEVLRDLSEADLKELGLTLGQRKKLMKALVRLHETLPVSPEVQEDSKPEAERRQLTVMFVDLIGSTALSQRLDPEEMQALLARFYQTITEAVGRFNGYVAKLLGDGILVYFGWPQAHEDEAERALRAALAATDALRGIETAEPLTCRIGIATGLVVVGEGAGEADQVVGVTPNLAARLEALAEPNSAVLDEATRRLVGDVFELRALPPAVLKGFDDPVNCWALIGERLSKDRFQALYGRRLSPFVGRSSELQWLRDHWGYACEGEGQVVLLSGDAGIGKSRLVLALEEVLHLPDRQTIRLQCSALHRQSPFYPLIRELEQTAAFQRQDSGETRLQKVESHLADETPNTRAALTDLLSLPGKAELSVKTLSPLQRRELLQAFWCRRLLAAAQANPLLVIVEDAHWIDATTMALLSNFVAELQGHPILLLVTHRPEWRADFAAASHVASLRLSRLSRALSGRLIDQIAGTAAEEDLKQSIAQRAEGNPLFIEELTKSLLESDTGQEGVPDSLQTSFLARLDSLGADRDVAHGAALLGRRVTADVLAEVIQQPIAAVAKSLERLVEREILTRGRQLGEERFTFKHALLQEAAQSSVLKSRRRALHLRAAEAFASLRPTISRREPETLAYHFSQGGAAGQAAGLWLSAGERAAAAGAAGESASHFRAGLDCYAETHDEPRAEAVEVQLELGLAIALTMEQGYRDLVGRHYRRAAELARQGEDPDRKIRALFGLWRYQSWKGDKAARHGLSDELVTLSRSLAESQEVVLGPYAATVTAFTAGALSQALRFGEETVSFYEDKTRATGVHRYAQDPQVTSLAVMHFLHWLQGDPRQADLEVEKARRLAEELGDSYTAMFVRIFETMLRHMERRESLARSAILEAEEIARRNGYASWAPHCRMLLGWDRVVAGDAETGLADLEEGATFCLSEGIHWMLPYHLSRRAEARFRHGDPKGALSGLDEAIALAEDSGDLWWLPELHRLRALVLLQEGGGETAHPSLTAAIDLAREQGSRMLELRGLTSLVDRFGAEAGSAGRELRQLLLALDGAADLPDLIDARDCLSRVD